MYLFFVSVQIAFDVYAYMFDMCTNKVYLLTYLQLARLIALNVLPNASYDGSALSIDGANPSIARDINTDN